METLNLFNVSDLYKSQEKLSHDLQNLMNLLDYCGDKSKKDINEEEIQKEARSILSPAEESYLESIIENKVDAIINASKCNNRLKNSLYKLVDAFKVFDSQFIYASPASSDIDNNHVSIQTQTPPQSPVLTESEVQTDINDSIGEVIVLETINNEQKTPVRIVGANEGTLEDNLPHEESLDDLQHIEKIRKTFKKLVKDQQKREKKNNEKISEETNKVNQDSEDTIITNKKQDLSLRHSTSNLSEAIKNSQIKVTKDAEVEVNLEKEKEKDNNNIYNAHPINNNDINPNTNNNEQEKINNKNKNESSSSSNNNDINNNSNNKNHNIITSTTATLTTINNEDHSVEKSNTKEYSTVIKPINVKSRKNYKRKQKNQSRESFTNPMFMSSSGSSLNLTPSPSQGIYLGKSNTQQTVLSTRIQSIFSKRSASTTTTKDAECQTESYKVVIRGEDYNIPPGYLGHYAVVPLWAIWVIGYYYKKKTKPKSMWKFLALKTPGLLAKSRAQNRTIKRVERITN